jgi:hypothetical protein
MRKCWRFALRAAAEVLRAGEHGAVRCVAIWRAARRLCQKTYPLPLPCHAGQRLVLHLGDDLDVQLLCSTPGAGTIDWHWRPLRFPALRPVKSIASLSPTCCEIGACQLRGGEEVVKRILRKGGWKNGGCRCRRRAAALLTQQQSRLRTCSVMETPARRPQS